MDTQTILIITKGDNGVTGKLIVSSLLRTEAVNLTLDEIATSLDSISTILHER